MATTRPAYAPDLTNDAPPPVGEALARVWPNTAGPASGGYWPTKRGYQSNELGNLAARASNRARTTGRQWALWARTAAEINASVSERRETT